MADSKISALPASTTPLAGTEVLPIVQSSATVKVAVSDLTAGRAVSALSYASTTGATFATSSGNVGIGNGSPTQKLEVTGGGQFGSGNTTSSGGLALRVGVFGSVPSNATDAFVGVHNTGGPGTTAGDLVLMPRSSTGVGNNIVFLTGQTTPAVRATIDTNGNLGLGATANASAILDAQSTTKGVRMPNMTTTQKNAIASPAAGLMVFDTTLAKLCVYSGAAWQTITSV